MSVSLYYTARRQQPIARQEEELCRQIGDRYDARYPYGELYEGFCIYDLEQDKGELEWDVIFSGATKLPPEDSELVCQIANWWLDCLEEITQALPGAQWHVNLDDFDLEWTEEERFRFPEA